MKNNDKMVLEVEDLTTSFEIRDGIVNAVNNISFKLERGKILGVVGESGSGKSQLFMSIMGLLARNGMATGSVKFQNDEILNLPANKLNNIRGSRIGVIFQDPMTCLNPFLTIKTQMTEVLMEHKGMSFTDALAESIAMLDLVSIPSVKSRIKMYPHEFSGGMRQRVMIAMSLLCKPDVLIADEPTTALDVTIQAQILDLISDLKDEFNMAVAVITHDLGVVAKVCDEVMVMYGGRIMEKGDVKDIFYNPTHPYTAGLLSSMPRIDEKENHKLFTIGGQPPNLQNLPKGCPFAPRCKYVLDKCEKSIPDLKLLNNGHKKACFVDKVETHLFTQDELI